MARKYRGRTFASVGDVVSSGTLRLEDIMPAFLAALDALREDRTFNADACAAEHGREERELGAIEQRMSAEGYYETEEATWDAERLEEMLDAFTPPGCTFGAHDGDGALFGFFPSADLEADRRAERADAFRFFAQHGGYCVGFRAQGALALARAEQGAADQGLTFHWQPDQEPDLSWLDGTDERGRYLFPRSYREADHCVEGCSVVDPRTGETLASLWGIVDASDEYRRTVQAELALEVLSA